MLIYICIYIHVCVCVCIIYIIQNTHVQIAIVQLANRTNLNRAAYTSECTPAATPTDNAHDNARGAGLADLPNVPSPGKNKIIKTFQFPATMLVILPKCVVNTSLFLKYFLTDQMVFAAGWTGWGEPLPFGEELEPSQRKLGLL